MELLELLKRLQEMDGTDLHVIAGLPPAVRVNDELVPLRDVGRPTPERVRDMIYAIMEREEIERFENDPQCRFELDFARGFDDLGRFRFNLHKQRGSLSVTIRALSNVIPSIDTLGLPNLVHEFARSRRGLVLVTGPAGSGRSTTLASLIDEINHMRGARIMTIEDPVEYIIPCDRAYVTQREVGDGADTLSFENALRSARRQNVDVIMIGHLGGYEAMRRALELAEMGVLVFASMSTLSATQTLARFIECFPAEEQAQAVSQLSAYLLGVLAQVLLRTTDRKGRVAACEAMRVNAVIRSEIRLNRLDSLYSLIQSGMAEGMQTMDQSLIDLARRKLIDYAAARPYIRDDVTHRTIYQMTGETRTGTPLPAGAMRPVAARDSAAETAAPSDSQVRRRLGAAVIPPWEQTM
jgi:twitching motility protein PilT